MLSKNGYAKLAFDNARIKNNFGTKENVQRNYIRVIQIIRSS